MIKLSDTQRVILSRTAQHGAPLAEPSKHLPAAAPNAVLRRLMAKCLLEEIAAPREYIYLAWRPDEDGASIALRVTPIGLAAIGVEPPEHRPEGDQEAPAQPAEAALFPAAGEGDSQAAVLPPPLSAASETAEGPQRPPVTQRAGMGRVAALHAAAETVLTAWYAPEQEGTDDATTALRDALASAGRTEQRWDPGSNILRKFRCREVDRGASTRRSRDVGRFRNFALEVE